MYLRDAAITGFVIIQNTIPDHFLKSCFEIYHFNHFF